ncbi:MAG: LPS export ABC transporter permease LptF, partial [Polaromonas sp.]|nr:LPS export ABC transporter permease LptF [Polaromonas sp.]
MLFQSSIRRELARSFGATFVVLITIVLTIVLIRTLGQASRGAINPQDVMLFMAYSALGRLPTILTLSLFIAMVGTLSRMYRDSEMVVWFTSGRGLVNFAAPLFRFAWPVLLIVALTALFIWPWTNQQTRDMQQRYAGRSDIDRIAPGQFQESSGGNRVFFIDRDAKTDQKSSNNVFIAANEKGKNSVTTARSGRIEITGEKQVLILENGQRLENENGKNSLKISNFVEYGSAAGSTAPQSTEASDAKLLSIPVLVSAPTRANLSELAWRLGLAVAAVNFVVLAVALANVNPRGGRSGNFVFVVLTFLVYNNLVNLGQSWILGGLVSFGGWLVLLHG